MSEIGIRFDPSEATKETYWTTAPYEYLYQFKDDNFVHQKKMEQLSESARLVGVRNFKKMYSEYVKSVRQSSAIPVGSVTDFQGQPLELQTGKWRADETGVSIEGDYQTTEACNHPILPIERLINIDSGTEKLKIAFRAGKVWREFVAEKSTLASSQSIIRLADYGVSVTSETAKALVKFFQDIEHLNYAVIPEKRSVARLGWIRDHGFSPFVPDLVFDGEANFRTLFDSVRQHGSEQAWLQIASEVRRGSLTARIVLAASFASVLVDPCGCLPFFVHLWGSESGTGKTVALMVAASVWACPAVGQYVQTFNSTAVSRERMAAFYNSLPMMIDELQLAKDARGKQQFDVYLLAEGVGKGRGTKFGGVEKTATWANCIITTGETPIVQAGSGAGAVNRVIDIECRESEPVILEGHRISNAVKANYGFAGRRFVDRLTEEGFDEAKQLYSSYFTELSKGETTEKQAMAAALILAADQLATDWIFQDDSNVTAQEIRQFLATKAEVSATVRGYDYLCDWVTQNSTRFCEDPIGETYGILAGSYAYIINTVFQRACEEAGFSTAAMLSYLDKGGLLRKQGGKRTYVRKINGIPTRCIAMELPCDEPLDV